MNLIIWGNGVVRTGAHPAGDPPECGTDSAPATGGLRLVRVSEDLVMLS